MPVSDCKTGHTGFIADLITAWSAHNCSRAALRSSSSAWLSCNAIHRWWTVLFAFLKIAYFISSLFRFRIWTAFTHTLQRPACHWLKHHILQHDTRLNLGGKYVLGYRLFCLPFKMTVGQHVEKQYGPDTSKVFWPPEVPCKNKGLDRQNTFPTPRPYSVRCEFMRSKVSGYGYVVNQDSGIDTIRVICTRCNFRTWQSAHNGSDSAYC